MRTRAAQALSIGWLGGKSRTGTGRAGGFMIMPVWLWGGRQDTF